MTLKGLTQEEFIDLFKRGGMHAIYEKVGLCYLNPTEPPTSRPLIDRLTIKAASALRRAKKNHICFMGHHACLCGKAQSAAYDLILPDGTLTNSLLVHYLAMHRDEVNLKDLQIIGEFDVRVEKYPTSTEIWPSPETFDYLPFSQ